MQATCKGARRDGSPCRAPGTMDGWCFAHHPDSEPERTAARAAGGKGKANAVRAQKYLPDDLRPVLAEVIEALSQVHSGDIKPQQGTAIAALAASVAKLYEVAEVERRLEEAERKVQAAQTGAQTNRAWPGR